MHVILLEKPQERRLGAPRISRDRLSLPQLLVRQFGDSFKAQVDSPPRYSAVAADAPAPSPLQELSRCRGRHPRLRFPRLAAGREGPAQFGSASATGIVPSARPAEDGSSSADGGARSVKRTKVDDELLYQATVIGPESIFYSGKEVFTEELVLPLLLPSSWERDAITAGRRGLDGMDADPPSPKTTKHGIQVRQSFRMPFDSMREQDHYGSKPSTAIAALGQTAQPSRAPNSRQTLLRRPGIWSDSTGVSTGGGSGPMGANISGSWQQVKYRSRQPPLSHIVKAGPASSPRRNTAAVKLSHEYMDCENWSVADDYMETLLLQADLSSMQRIDLSGNRLGERTVHLMTKLCEEFAETGPLLLASLRLAQNRLGTEGGLAIARFLSKVRLPLKELDLSGNHIGDHGCVELCKALTHSGCHLHRLGLAENNLGQQHLAGAALGNLVGYSKELADLDLHWNDLHGEDAAEFFDGLLSNATVWCSLRVLDLSWNRLGVRSCLCPFGERPGEAAAAAEASAEDPAETERRAAAARPAARGRCKACLVCDGIASTLSQALGYNDFLSHLDLNCSDFSANQSRVISEAWCSGGRQPRALFFAGNTATGLSVACPLLPLY